MEQRSVTLQAPATNTTQDFEIAGFGTPDFCLVISNRGAQDAFGAHGGMCVGMYDGTTQNCLGYGIEDDVAASANTSKAWTRSAKVVNTRWGVSDERTAVASMATDKVTLTWSGTTSHRPYTTVWMFKGATAASTGYSAAVGTQDSAQTETTTGVNPVLILMASNRCTGNDATTSHGTLTIGFAYDNGASIEQYCAGQRVSQSDPVDCNYHISNDLAGAVVTGSGDTIPGFEVTSMGTGDFEVTDRQGNGNGSFIYLAIELTEDVHTFSAAVTTSAGDWDPSNAGFTPQCLFMVGGPGQTINGNESAGATECLAVYIANDDNDESGHTSIVEDSDTGATLMTAESQQAAELQIALTSGGSITEEFKASNPTFDATGVVFADADVNHAASARLVCGFMVDSPVAGGEVINRVLTENAIITDAGPETILKQRRPGDRIELLTDATFLYTAFGRLVHDNFSVADAISILSSFDRQVLDIVSVSDLISTIHRAFNELSDTISLTDSEFHYYALGRIATDDVDPTDISIQQIARGQIDSESLVVTDGFQKAITVGESQETFVVVLDEIVEIVDTQELFKSGVIVRDVLDSLAVDEFIAIAAFRNSIMLDSVGMIDSAILYKTRAHLDAESIDDVIDSLGPVRRRYRNQSDDVPEPSDSATGINTKARLSSESMLLSDDVIVTRSAILNTIVSADSISLVDFIRSDVDSFLSPSDICIEHGIEAQ